MNMTETNPIKPPFRASPPRRLFHMLIAVAGWALFVYWWWIVFHRVSRSEVRFTLVFVALSLVLIVGATALWAWHNVRIFRRKGPRTHVREVTPDYSRDRIGRPVTFPQTPLDRLTAPVVHVRFRLEGKSYMPAATLPPRAAAPGNSGGVRRR